MNSLLERVNLICQAVRRQNTNPVTFKKLIGSIRKTFKEHNTEISLKTKKEKSLDHSHFYVMAYYDADEDFNQEISIEVYVHHNFEDADKFQNNQITDFLIQIYDAVVHELRHQQQSRKRNFETFSSHITEPYSQYLADPDEIDAYALSIAIELLRAMPRYRAERYMTRLEILSKMKIKESLVSPNLKAYMSHYRNNLLIKKLAKKVYKNLKEIDQKQIFM